MQRNAGVAVFAGTLLASFGCRDAPKRVDDTVSSAVASASATSAPSASASTRAGGTPLTAPRPTLEKTRVPTAKEWRTGMDKPVMGALGLGCEARMVREWVRVSCRDANANGGAPSAVDAAHGGDAETYTFAKNGVTSVVTRFLPGTSFSAKFSWHDGTSFPLMLQWPAGKNELPEPLGKFEGAPDDAVPGPERAAACYCSNVAYSNPPNPTSCVGVAADAYRPECLRGNAKNVTIGDPLSCEGLRNCEIMAPAGWAACLPDEVYETSICVTCRCAKACGSGKPNCKKGFVCTDNGLGEKYCQEQ